MNRIKVKSGSFEIEIETDQPQTPKELAGAIVDVVKASPPPRVTQLLENEVQVLPLKISVKGENPASEPLEKSKKPASKKNNGENTHSAGKVVEELIAEGKFDKALGLGEVQSITERMAVGFSLSTIANALADQVRKKRLERIGDKGRFKYIRKGVQVDSVTSEPAKSGSPAEAIKDNTKNTLDAIMPAQS